MLEMRLWSSPVNWRCASLDMAFVASTAAPIGGLGRDPLWISIGQVDRNPTGCSSFCVFFGGSFSGDFSGHGSWPKVLVFLALASQVGLL